MSYSKDSAALLVKAKEIVKKKRPREEDILYTADELKRLRMSLVADACILVWSQYPSSSRLPDELVGHVLAYLDAASLARFGASSWGCHALSHNPKFALWQQHAHRLYPDPRTDRGRLSLYARLCQRVPCQKVAARNSPPSWMPSTALKDFEDVTLDGDGFVTKVDLTEEGLTGTIDLTKLPQGLQELHLGNNRLTGTIDLTTLPQGLQGLHLYSNQLTGPIELTKLPQRLQIII